MQMLPGLFVHGLVHNGEPHLKMRPLLLRLLAPAQSSYIKGPAQRETGNDSSALLGKER